MAHDCPTCAAMGTHWMVCKGCFAEVPYSLPDHQPGGMVLVFGLEWRGLYSPTMCPSCDPRHWHDVDLSEADASERLP